MYVDASCAIQRIDDFLLLVNDVCLCIKVARTLSTFDLAAWSFSTLLSMKVRRPSIVSNSVVCEYVCVCVCVCVCDVWLNV